MNIKQRTEVTIVTHEITTVRLQNAGDEVNPVDEILTPLQAGEARNIIEDVKEHELERNDL